MFTSLSVDIITLYMTSTVALHLPHPVEVVVVAFCPVLVVLSKFVHFFPRSMLVPMRLPPLSFQRKSIPVSVVFSFSSQVEIPLIVVWISLERHERLHPGCCLSSGDFVGGIVHLSIWTRSVASRFGIGLDGQCSEFSSGGIVKVSSTEGEGFGEGSGVS